MVGQDGEEQYVVKHKHPSDILLVRWGRCERVSWDEVRPLPEEFEEPRTVTRTAVSTVKILLDGTQVLLRTGRPYYRLIPHHPKGL